MNISRQLKRVKAQADHLFLRSDRTDVVGELRTAEEQSEELRLLCESYTRSLEKVLHTHTTADEKKLRKVPEYQAAEGLKEGLNSLQSTTENHDLLRSIVERVVEIQLALGMDVLEFEDRVEKQVLNPLTHIIKEEFPHVAKQKKQLKQVGLDLDAAKTRWRSTQANPNNQNTKVEMCREELEEAELKLDQARDNYACDIFSLLARHREVSQYVCGYLELQREFLQNTLNKIDQVLPDMRSHLEQSSCSPVYGIPLHDHLRIMQKEIAAPIEVCVKRIIEMGIYEEGMFRVAGSTTKVRRLKGAFDANLVTYEILALADEHDRDYDVHVVAGALKCYLRELPEPLLTHILHDQWLEAVRHTDHQQRLRALWMVASQLPPANLANLRYLIKFLSMLAAQSAINKMTPSNISIVIAPNLIWAQRDNDDQADMSTLGRNMSLTSEYRAIVENLVEYSDYFFKEEVDFGVIPKVPPSPSLAHSAQNGTVPATPSAQPRSGTHGHRRNISADLGRFDPGNVPVTAGECESPKQPQRMKRKPQAPKPPQVRPVSTHGIGEVGFNAQELSGTTALNTTSASGSPEQTRSKTPPKEGVGQPAPAARLQYTNSLRRPTAEPPKPPSLAPTKPPRPSPPNINDNQEKLSIAAQSEATTETKSVPLGFEQLPSAKDLDSTNDDSEVFLRRKPSGDGPAPIGFVVDTEKMEDGSNSPKTSRAFRQSLENVLQLQAAGQPVALPRHSQSASSSEGDLTAPQPVLPLPRTSSVGESARPAVVPTPAQRSNVPVATPTVQRVRESIQTSDKPEPLQRSDKPALPEKPSIVNNRSTIVVDHSKPQVPEKPIGGQQRNSNSNCNIMNTSTSDINAGVNEHDINDPMVLSQINDTSNSNELGNQHFEKDKQQVTVVQTNTGTSGDGSLKSGGSGKFTWPPTSETTAAASNDEEVTPDSTHL